jgi:hypothetical protein
VNRIVIGVLALLLVAGAAGAYFAFDTQARGSGARIAVTVDSTNRGTPGGSDSPGCGGGGCLERGKPGASDNPADPPDPDRGATLVDTSTQPVP